MQGGWRGKYPQSLQAHLREHTALLHPVWAAVSQWLKLDDCSVTSVCPRERRPPGSTYGVICH